MSDIVASTERRKIRLLVAVPTHERVEAPFSYDLAQMMGYMGANFIGDGPQYPIEAMNLSYVTGTYVHSARQSLAELAVTQKSDYVLWLDSDMRFPRDIFLKLVQHKKDIVGVNYSSRKLPPYFIAIKSIVPPVKCATGPDSTGLEEVEAIGFGAVLMKTRVLLDLHDPTGPKGPWFWYEWMEGPKKMMGEDVYFCKLLREAGHQIWVDHDTSKECKHVGSMDYRLEHVHDLIEAAAAEEAALVEA